MSWQTIAEFAGPEIPCTLRSSSLRGYQITTPWWIPKWELLLVATSLSSSSLVPQPWHPFIAISLLPDPHLQRWTCGMPRRGGFTLGGQMGYGILRGSSPFPQAGWLVVLLWYWTSSTPEKERGREWFLGGVSLIHFWRQSQGVKHIATSQFLSRWLEPSCGFMTDIYMCQHPCIEWHYIQASRAVTHHSISISVMKYQKRIRHMSLTKTLDSWHGGDSSSGMRTNLL